MGHHGGGKKGLPTLLFKTEKGPAQGEALPEGAKIAGWQIVKKLGEGGFGAVKDPQGHMYAMKTERANTKVRVLKMEAKAAKTQHFCDILDAGRVDNHNFVVMTLVGPSLHDLRKQVPEPHKKFSMPCALSVSKKCLSAIEELHALGFIHRDLKPGNYAIGGRNPRKIYLLDFGMCRRFIDENGEVRIPRIVAGFRGTVRYASLSAHINRERCRKDDLETWLYQTITRGSLPWRQLEDPDETARMKAQCRATDSQELLGGCPREYLLILNYVDSLRYFDLPDYAAIQKLMSNALVISGKPEYPYDWEPDNPLCTIFNAKLSFS